MGFVCPKCNGRKDGRKKNSTTCLDCYTNAQVEDKLRSVLEKLEKRELDVQKRRDGERGGGGAVEETRRNHDP